MEESDDVRSGVIQRHRNLFAAFRLYCQKQTFSGANGWEPRLRFLREGRVRLRPTPRSADRARSPARVSAKREYFKYSPETFADFAHRLFNFGV
jgi:hypothetical protein